MGHIQQIELFVGGEETYLPLDIEAIVKTTQSDAGANPGACGQSATIEPEAPPVPLNQTTGQLKMPPRLV